MSDSLSLQLLDEHRKRYERIKVWREAQSDPYFTEVSSQWRREFETRESANVVRNRPMAENIK
jgi:hypothetical protein